MISSKDHKIKLISTVTTHDADGFRQETETATEVYAAIESVTGTEFYQTGLLGIQASFRAVCFAVEYNGEKTIEYDGSRYTIYRTYMRNVDEIELYAEGRKGS